MSEIRTDPGRVLEQAAVECVARSVEGFSLHEMREAPDGDLIHERGFHVGVEVVRTIDQQYLDARVRLQELFEGVRAELDARGAGGNVIVYFNVSDVISTPQRHRRLVPGQVATFLETHTGANFETAELRGSGVQCVARIERPAWPGAGVHLGWRSQTLHGSLAAIALQKKDERLRHYRELNGDYFGEYWLVIASLGPGTLEDGGFSMLLSRDFVTAYDRVFLIIRGMDGKFVEARDVTPVAHQRSRLLAR